MLFYADKISDNIRKREPEGYLICVNVPIARTGSQQYLQDEIGQKGEKTVSVYRPEEEVFSPATMASFEGMPVTNDHPDEEDGVTVDNIQYLQKGHCQNVRRGTGKDKDLLIADLVITDPQTIQDILDGKREISCGYNYELVDEDGKLVQRQIRGNHIAIVDKGRAGHRVCIKDSAPTNERRKPKMVNTKHNKVLSKMLAVFARDAEPEEIEEAVEAIDEITSEQPVIEEEIEAKDEGPDKMDLILDKLDQLLAAKDCKDEAPEEDPLAKLENDLDELEKIEPEEEEDEDPVDPEKDPDEMEAHFVDPEQINEEDEDPEEIIAAEEEEEIPVADRRACDAARVALNAIKPILAKLPPSERKKAADAAVAQIRKSSGMDAKPKTNGYAALKKARKRIGDRANEADIGRRIMESRNPNYQK